MRHLRINTRPPRGANAPLTAIVLVPLADGSGSSWSLFRFDIDRFMTYVS
jgi:hypothetical protein